ncbi:MAG: hypothetical protein AAF458_13050 [Pseudomonadota bacterium]
MQVSAACHCGNISFDFTWPDAAGPLMGRACGCSFCQKHGGIWTSSPEGRLSARIADGDALRRYSFGTKTADFYVCSDCGAVPFVVSEIEERKYAVINVNTFEGDGARDLETMPTNFDGEDVDGRLGRRERNWIRNVEVVIA